MSATFVASSNQMFSAFGQPTRSPSPAFNPFATNSDNKGSAFGIGGAGDSSNAKRNKRSAGFGDQSDSDSKRKPNNPFKSKDANLSDGGGRQKNRKADDKRTDDSKKNPFNSANLSKKPVGQSARNNGSNPFATTRDEPRPTSSSSAEVHDKDIPETRHSDDPHARRVYEQLRKDGINPPPWPSQPGNPKNKAELTKFRERYEAYRSKARASLTKAGLIDDPEKRKTLQDAIDFKGICEDMCPEYEKITRINESDVNQPEKNPKTTYANTHRMVKKLARSAAGQEAPLPMDVRSVAALKRTLDYLIDDLLRDDGNLPALHGFLWDRTRAIRRDFTFFSSLTPDEMKAQVYVLENITRFHVTALHLLTQDGKAPEDFVEQQELEQLGKALLSLRDAYDDCNDQGIRCENEAEFRAYYLIFHAYDSNIIETLQRQWKANLWRDSDEVRTAVSLVEALQNTHDYHGPLKDAPSLAASAAYQSYFRIVEDPKVSYTMACFAECHFPRLRRSILAAIKKGLARPREGSKDVTAAVLNKFLRFDTVQQAIDFAELHDIEFGQCEEDPSNINLQYAKLDSRGSLPHHRLQHQFSHTLVEKKRGSRRLPDLIHETIHEDKNFSKPTTNGSGEGSLFVSNTQTTTNKPLIPTGPKATTPSAFSSVSTPGGSWGNNKPVNGTSGTTFNGTTTTNGSALQQPTPQSNPFASGLASAAKKPAVNPFAPSTSSATPSFFNNASGTVTNTQQPIGTGTTPSQTPFASSDKPSTASSEPVINNPFGRPFAPSSKDAAPATQSSLFQPPKSTVPSAEKASSNETASDKFQGQTPACVSGEQKPPAINILPPTPQLSGSPFNSLTPPQTSTNTTPQVAQPITGPGSSMLTGEQSKPGTSILGSQPPVSATPQFSFPPLGASTSLTLTSPGVSQPSTALTTTQPPQEPISPPAPSAPPRDLLGDFTKWFVTGDDGLIEEFQAFMLDNILQGVYRKYVHDEEIRRQKEEDDKALAEAQKFRVYSLSVKYFYRWKETARDRRLSQLRRSGREQMRAYYEAQRAEQARAQKEAARKAAREKAELADLNRSEELKDFLKHKKPKRRQAAEEEALRASGVLSGISNEQEAISRIVRRTPSVSSTLSSKQSTASVVRGGSKTRALRQQFGDQSATFRRSLPPMASRNTASPEPSNRISRVSERWRLKAMGIVQLPDGTAVPESMANEMHYAKRRQPGAGAMGPPTSDFNRRASVSDFARPEGRHRLSSSHGTTDTNESDSTATKNKRKRTAEDDDETTQERQPKSSTHKRVVSDAQTLINELRAMREEMEEGATWFRDQNDRMQSEVMSRGSTPWDQDG